MKECSLIPDAIDLEEYLYRGVVENQWDTQHNRPSSATFKDSKGASVDRDNLSRDKEDCIASLLGTKTFKAVCRVKESAVKEIGALTKYLPIPDNLYHCEIHNSEDIITLSKSMAKRLRDKAETVYQAD